MNAKIEELNRSVILLTVSVLVCMALSIHLGKRVQAIEKRTKRTLHTTFGGLDHPTIDEVLRDDQPVDSAQVQGMAPPPTGKARKTAAVKPARPDDD